MERNTHPNLHCSYSKISCFLFVIAFQLMSLSGISQNTDITNFNKGKELYEKGEFVEAISFFKKAVEMEESNADFHYWLGAANVAALEDASMFKKATLSYDARSSLIKAIELDPAHVNARIQLANYYIQAPAIAGGSYSKAQEQAAALKKYDPIYAAELEATIFLQKEEYDEAEKVYKTLISDGQHNEKVYYRLSIISLSRQNYQQAIEYCQQSIDEYPEYLMGLYQYGKVASIGNIETQSGEENLKKYIQSDIPDNLPKKHWAYYRLGKIHELDGNIEEAKSAYENALSHEKGFKEAKKALRELD